MKRFGFVIEAVSDEALATYQRLHKDVPAEISGPQGALEEIGLSSMSIHWLPPRTLFMQVEAQDGFDPLRDFTRALALHPVVQAWDDQMHGPNALLKRIGGNDTRLNWFLMDPVFDWESPKVQRILK